MNEEIVAAIAEHTGFTPWEIILMAVVAALFFLLIKLTRESITAVNNSTNAINNNTTAFKEFKTEIVEKLKDK